MNARVTRALLCLSSLLAASCAAAAAPAAIDPPGLDPPPGEPRTAAWAEIVEGLDSPLGGGEDTTCHRGEPACLDAVIGEMEVRLAEGPCAHTAPFAFMYLEMTRGVLDGLERFDDPQLVSLMDARFAQQYFDALDNWADGRVEAVPAAWQIAFATADRGESPAAVDLLLGMNAHISRDLAYTAERALAELGASPERIEDYELVNEVIGNVKSSMLERAADRFDPSLLLLDLELDEQAAPQPVELIAQWRSIAFDLGRRLRQGPTPSARAEVIAEIERQAAAGAGVVVAMEAGGRAPALSPALRDEYCRQQAGKVATG